MQRCIPTKLFLATLSLFCLPNLNAEAGVMATWSDTSNGAVDGISISVNNSIALGNLQLDTLIASDSNFVSQFANQYEALDYDVPTAGADITSQFTFSAALPTGSRLIILDVDFADERFLLTANGSALTLVSQLESIAGASSNLPIYNALTGELRRNTASALPNNFEASVFDLSGLTSFDLRFLRSTNPNISGTRLAISAPGSTSPPPPPAVPEPATAVCFAFIAIAAGRLRSRVAS